jgi:hypothetical protein
VQRGLSPREMLRTYQSISVICYRKTALFGLLSEGRTKDGNITNPGVLKMLAMGSDEANLMDYFKKNKSSTRFYLIRIRS